MRMMMIVDMHLLTHVGDVVGISKFQCQMMFSLALFFGKSEKRASWTGQACTQQHLAENTAQDQIVPAVVLRIKPPVDYIPLFTPHLQTC
jgi:hypothetical protein